MNNNNYHPLFMIGVGAGAGICAIWLLVELWPLLLLGGAAWLAYKGLESQAAKTQEA